jgi:AraC-like DNA-binding protein
LQDLQLKEKIEGNIVAYMKAIDQFSYGSENYRVSKFTLNDLSAKLQIPKSHLVFLFKYHSKISFPEYKKIIRIHDGLELIKADYLKNNTFESLSQKIGFASYNTFFVSFKDVTGVTPQEFIFVGMTKKTVPIIK